MGVSTIAKKRHKKFNSKVYERAKKLATDEAVEQVLLGYLSIWSVKELNRICAVHDFVCVPLGRDHYRVGRFDLKKQPNNFWQVSDCDGYALHEFGNQQAAVFFCLYETRYLYARAREFKDCDNELSKTQQEVNYLREKSAADDAKVYKRFYKWCSEVGVERYGYDFTAPRYRLGRARIGLIDPKPFEYYYNNLSRFPYVTGIDVYEK